MSRELCNTSGVLIPKPAMSSYALQSIWHLVKILIMHTLKQVYIYVVCVELYCLNQVQNLVWIWNFQENPDFLRCNLLGKKVKVIHFLVYCLYMSFHDEALVGKHV